MANAQAERPRFYQGQYLGPEDLAAAVDHGRWARARHDLGAHAWGIAAGLALREVQGLGGGWEAFVEPGYAVDGFGRPLTVTAALPVPLEKLQALNVAPAPGQTSVPVTVWLRYAERETREPPYGFETCDSDDAFARTAEGVEVEVGSPVSEDQREKVEIDGEEMKAYHALRTVEDTAPLLRDGSAPFQTFPASEDSWWLVPLGVVRWSPGARQLEETTEADRREGRRLRRYVGVVAEGVWAAGDLIRLRSRLAVPGADQGDEDAVADERPMSTGNLDMAYDSATGRATFQELVWIEGNLRVVGDTRLFGGKLELRDEDGEDGGVPMWVRRVEANNFLDEGGVAASGRDLELLVGTGADKDGRNRLVIGMAPPEGQTAATGQVVVQSNGRVGIGTLIPLSALRAPLTIRAIGAGEELLSFERADGTARKWHVNQLPGGADGLSFNETLVRDGRLFLRAGGGVGIGTTQPDAYVDVAGAGATVGGRWLRIGDGGDGGRFWVEYGDQFAPLVVLSAFDDPPRIRFQQTGTGSEAAPQFSSWIGHGHGNSSALAVMGGNLGVGTTDPQVPLHVRGTIPLSLGSPASGALMVGDGTGLAVVLDGDEIMARNGAATSSLHLQARGGDLRVHSQLGLGLRFIVTDGGRVGIGTDTPAQSLDVRGNIALGPLGDHFAVAGLGNLRVLAGHVNVVSGAFSGSGYTGSWTGTGTGQATVDFNPTFSGTPVVVATAYEAEGDDQVVNVTSMGSGGFTLVAADVEHGGGSADVGIRENTRFTFIAIGPR